MIGWLLRRISKVQLGRPFASSKRRKDRLFSFFDLASATDRWGGPCTSCTHSLPIPIGLGKLHSPHGLTVITRKTSLTCPSSGLRIELRLFYKGWEEAKGGCPLALEEVFKPKSMGGLGLRHIISLDEAHEGRWWRRLINARWNWEDESPKSIYAGVHFTQKRSESRIR